MIKYIMTISKWLPLESEDFKLMFSECGNLKKVSNDICEEISTFLNDYHKKITPKVSNILVEDKLFLKVFKNNSLLVIILYIKTP